MTGNWMTELKPDDLVMVRYNRLHAETHCVLRVMKRFVETQLLGQQAGDHDKWSYNGYRYGSGQTWYTGPYLEPYTDEAAQAISRQRAWDTIRRIARTDNVAKLSPSDLDRLEAAFKKIRRPVTQDKAT